MPSKTDSQSVAAIIEAMTATTVHAAPPGSGPPPAPGEAMIDDIPTDAARAIPDHDDLEALVAEAAGRVEADLAARGILLGPTDPERLARIVLASEYDHPDRPRLVSQGRAYHEWDGTGYVDVTDGIDAVIGRVVMAEYHRLNRKAVEDFAAEQRRRGAAARAAAAGSAAPPASPPPRPPVLMAISRRKLGDVRAALQGLAAIGVKVKMPAWIDRSGSLVAGPFPAAEAIAARNAILRPSRDGSTDPERVDPTPCFFAPAGLGYDYDPQAHSAELERFLESVLPGKHADARQTLQEWAGYLLTSDIHQEKILFIKGVTRSGKGTYASILKGLLGAGYEGTTLQQLGANFGLQDWIGKRLAVVGDARLSGSADESVIIERLLMIASGDDVPVDVKYRSPVVGQLRTRIMMLANECPRLRDDSLAFAERLLAVEFPVSFAENPDRRLKDRLMAEGPGLLRWALDGLRSLRRRGHFVQPESGLQTLGGIKEANSDILTFLDEACERSGPDVPSRRRYSVPRDALYRAYRRWSDRRGVPESRITGPQEFHRRMGAVRGVTAGRPVVDKKQVHSYFGIRLIPGSTPAPAEKASARGPKD